MGIIQEVQNQGIISTVRDRLRSVWGREKVEIQKAMELAHGVSHPQGFDAFSVYGRYGMEPLMDYLRIEQELMTRFLDYSEMESLSLSSCISTPYGNMTIKEILEKCKKDPKYVPMVFSYDHATKKVVVSPTLKPVKTGEKKKMCKVFMDNGKSMKVTADHLFMLRSGEYRKVKDLKPGDSLMPCRIMEWKGWWYLVQPDQKSPRGLRKRSPVHRMLVECLAGRELPFNFDVHHKNHNKKDNRPENLEIIHEDDHIRGHGIEASRDPELNADRARSVALVWQNRYYKSALSKVHRDRYVAKHFGTTESFGEWKCRVSNFQAKGILSGQHRELISEGRARRWDSVLSKEVLERLLQMHGSLNELCDFLGCYQAVIDRRILEYGLSKELVGTSAPEPGFLSEIKKKVEAIAVTKELAEAAIRECGNREEVLSQLGITWKTFYNLVEKHGLDTSKLDERSHASRMAHLSATQYAKTKSEIPKNKLVSLLRDSNGIAAAQNTLGIRRKTLDRLIADYEINLEPFRLEWRKRWREGISRTMKALRASTFNAKVVSVEVSGDEDTYDIPVPKYHNFAAEGVFVHNSYPELCLAGDTLIDTADGFSTLKSLADAGKTIKIPVFDLKNNVFVLADGTNARLTIKDAEIWKVTFNNGAALRGTPNHKVLLFNKTWKMIQDLKAGDDVMGRDLAVPIRVASVMGDGRSDVYDLTTPVYANFVANGVVVHNSASLDIYADEACLTAETEIPMSDGTMKTVGELYQLKASGCYIHAYDISLGKVIPGKFSHVSRIAESVPVLKVVWRDDSGKTGWARVTSDHKFLMADGSYIRSGDLRSGSKLMALKEAGVACAAEVMNVESGGTADVYDLVDSVPTHNFAAGCGDSKVFVRNTQFDVITGRTVWVESDDIQIKKLLQTMLDSHLQIDEDIWSIARSLCKMGNQFEEVLCTQEMGVIGLNALPPETVRRYERGKGMLVGFAQDPKGIFGLTVDDVDSTLQGKSGSPPGTTIFEPWQVVHFRLVSRTRQSVYGHCLAPETQVWCNPCVKPITEVESGDRVFMRHSGLLRTSPVIERVSNGIKKLFRLKTAHREIRSTEEHPFLVATGEKNREWRPLKRIRPGDKIVIATLMPGIGKPPTLGIRYNSVNEDTPVRLTQRGLDAVNLYKRTPKHSPNKDGVLPNLRGKGVSEGILKDFLVGKKSVPFRMLKATMESVGLPVFEGCYQIYRGERTTPLQLPDFVTPWFCRLWGFLTGDGWIHGSQVCFALGVYPDLNQKYTDLMAKTGLTVRKNGGTAYVDSKDLADLLRDLGWIDGVRNKRLPKWIWGLPEEYREEFLWGFMDADGWETTAKEKYKAHHIEICNEPLLRDLKTLIDGLGYKCGNIRKRAPRESIISTTGKVCRSSGGFLLTFYPTRLIRPFDVDVVKSIESDGEGEVYDVGVADKDHNFVANGIVAHNSVMEAARWIWRRLLLLEDAALIYRLTRTPTRWVFYIDVGKLPPSQALAHVRKIKNEFTKNKFVNDRGALDLRYNPLSCLDLKTEIPLLDGRTLPLSEIIREHAEGKEHWVYSFDTKTRLVRAGKVNRAEVTRRNAQMVEVSIDNGRKIRCTPDHRFFLRDGSQVQAKDLTPGTSLAPLYRYYCGKTVKNQHEYVVHLDQKNHKESTHWMVASGVRGWSRKDGFVVHHKNRNPLNNDPSNLDHILEVDHRRLHLEDLPWTIHTPEAKVKSAVSRRAMWADPARSPELRKQFREATLRVRRENPELAKHVSECGRRTLVAYNKSDAHRKRVSEVNRTERRWERAQSFIDRDVQREAVRKALSNSSRLAWKDPEFRARKSEQVRRDQNEWWTAYREWKTTNPEGTPRMFRKIFGSMGKSFVYMNHKVISVVFLDVREDTGCINVPEWHNFATAAGVFLANSDENLFIPVVDGKRTTEVDLMATPEWQVMDDLNYFREKLFSAIKIPKAYLASEGTSRARLLALEDVRFARTVMRVQREIRVGLRKICKIHLAALGIDPERVNFDVFMTNPSWAYEMAQIEVRNAKAEFADRVSKYLSSHAVMRMVFGFSDEEIEAIRKEQADEAASDINMESIRGKSHRGNSPMDIPKAGLSLGSEGKETDKELKLLRERVEELSDKQDDVAHRIGESKAFLQDLRSNMFFTPKVGSPRVIKSLGHPR